MRTHRFVGATSREVLHKVKQALGDDALILSNRACGDQIEVVALSASEARAHEDDFDTVVTLSSAKRDPDMDEPAQAPVKHQFPRIDAEPAAVAAPAPVEAAPAVAPVAAPAPIAAPVAAAPAPVAPAIVAAPAPIAPVIAAAPAIAAAAPVVATAGVATMMASTMRSATSMPQIAMFTPSTPMPAAAQSRPATLPAVTSWPAPVVVPAPVAAAPEAETPVTVPGHLDGILNEIQSLKATLQRDIQALATVDNTAIGVGKSGVMHELLNAGFSAKLAREVADEVCADTIDPTIDQVAKVLERELEIAEADDIINRGGVYALVGPTGVGKTTTVAKLAARAVVRFGASKVALLTTDTYRIGAHDQLRIYGRILSVPVHSVRDAADLARVLGELKDRHLVLIDTIGMSQRDRMVAEQAAMLAGCGDVKRLLLVQTTANARTLEQVVSAYRKLGVEGCILTKTDEAASMGTALDVVIRHKLPLHYVTDGQRVPEDLHLPDAAALVREALTPPADDVFDLAPEEMQFMMPAMLNTAAMGVAHV